jgi:PAS domain S-box-containing protein
MAKTDNNEFMAFFEQFLVSYFNNRSLKEVMSFVGPKFSGIGSAIHEICFTRKEGEKIFAEDLAQVQTPLKVTRKKNSLEQISDDVALIICLGRLEGEAEGLEFEIENFRMSAILVRDQKGIKIIHLHNSLPQMDSGKPDSYPIKLLKSALYETEEKFRQLFENTPAGLLYFDKNGVVKECNKKFLQIMSSTSEKIVGIDMLALDDQQAVNAVKTALKGRVGEYEGYYRPITSGKVVPLKATLAPIMSSDARVVGGVGIYEDIRDRKLAESKLHYQFQFEKIVATISSNLISVKHEEIPEVIINALKLTCQFFDADRAYIFQISSDGKTARNTYGWQEEGISPVNPQNQMVGIEDLDGMGGFIDLKVDHIHIPDLNNFPAELGAVKDILTTGDVKSVIILPLIHEGRLSGCFGYDCVNSPRSWTYEEITLLKVIGEIFSNAFARLDAEKKLQQREEKYRFVTENASDMIWVADLDENRLTYISPSAEKTLGYSADELAELSFDLYLSFETKAFFETRAKEISPLISPDKTFRFIDEAIYIHKNGNLIPTEVTTNWVMDAQTGRRIVIGVTRDITLRKKAEEQRALLEMQKIQTQKAESLGRMAGSIAYHFNNYMQIIAGNLELLAGLKTEKARKKRFDDAMRAIERAANLSSLMLSYVGNSHFGVEQISIDELFDQDPANWSLSGDQNLDKALHRNWHLFENYVLLVESDEMIRFITTSFLEHYKFRVIAVENGKEALKIYKEKQNEIKLVICDLLVPGDDGWKTISSLRKITPELPVILASSYDFSLIMKGNYSDQSVVYLKKPFVAKTLLQKVTEALEIHSSDSD